MVDASEVIENIRDYLEENKAKTVIICAVLVFMTLCGLVVAGLQDISSNKKEKVPDPEKFVMDQKLLVPDFSVQSEEYLTSRQIPENWSSEEIEKWFTLPDKSEIKKLGDSNDGIINEILGAAP